MKILIVDDDERRANELCEYLVRNGGFMRENIDIADCINEARNLLRVKYFDALVLDVVLPRRSGERATSALAVDLLRELNRSPKLRKPEKIIGLTGYIEDIESFREEFERFCLVVVPVHKTNGQWRERILSALTYTASSRMMRTASAKKLHVLTVHGIRTFGHWQLRLQALVEKQVEGIKFDTYRYGYFSIVAFLFPFARRREVKLLGSELKRLAQEHTEEQFYVFGHSFGTYLIANALKTLADDGIKFPLHTIIFCGSVLPERYKWDFLQSDKPVRIINDCADRDYALWASKAVVLGTGMAGKCGFHGLENERLTNRFFRGGHSVYFEDDDFMKKYWLPLFDADAVVVPVDYRRPSFVQDDLVEQLVCLAGFVKPYVYFAATIFLLRLALIWGR